MIRSARHVYGHRPDPVGYKRTPVHHLVGLSAPPASASLEAFLPARFDQGQTGRCVGYGKVGAIYTTGKGAIALGSPTNVYRNARAIDRVLRADGTYDPLVDEGSEPNQADRAIAEFGMLAFDPAVDGPDISPDELNREPTLLDTENSSGTELVGSYSIDDTADIAQVSLELRRAIAAGYAVTFAIPDTDDAFENYSGGVLGASSGQVYGGHENFCYAYETSPAGVLTFYGCNSWGETWGLHGLYAFNSTFLRRLVDIQVESVVKGVA